MTTVSPSTSAPPVHALPEGLAAPPTENTALAPSAPGTDPWAAFGATHGLHADVQRFAYAGPNGAGGGHAAPAPSKTAPPPVVHDPWQIDPAKLQRLKESADPATRRLGYTIEHAKVAYADLHAQGAKIVVIASAGNGGQPVLALVGKDFKGDQPVHVHTHYHGNNATVADPLGSKAGHNARIRDALARDPQLVFVLPEAGNAPPTVDSPTKGLDYPVDWTNVTSQAKTTDDALVALNATTSDRKEVVSFHSGGGHVMARLMALDRSGSLLRADRLELHDGLYGNPKHDFRHNKVDPAGWEHAFVAWGRKHPGVPLTYYHGNNRPERQQVVLDGFKGRVVNIEMGAQPAVPKNPGYNPHPHYRTTGEFLATQPRP